MTRLRSAGRVVGCCLLLWLTGCAGPQLKPVDLSAPGWRVQETQAVWCPKSGAPELIGELLVAGNVNGERLVQFSKQNLPMVTAQLGAAGWNLSSSLRSGRFGGGGKPTQRVPWFLFSELPPRTPPADSPWKLTQGTTTWRLKRADTGEYVEGALP